MAKKIKHVTDEDIKMLEVSAKTLRSIVGVLKQARAPKAAAKVRAAIGSVEGALRHALRIKGTRSISTWRAAEQQKLAAAEAYLAEKREAQK